MRLVKNALLLLPLCLVGVAAFADPRDVDDQQCVNGSYCAQRTAAGDHYACVYFNTYTVCGRNCRAETYCASQTAAGDHYDCVYFETRASCQ